LPKRTKNEAIKDKLDLHRSNSSSKQHDF